MWSKSFVNFDTHICVISEEQPVSGGGGVSGSRLNVRDG